MARFAVLTSHLCTECYLGETPFFKSWRLTQPVCLSARCGHASVLTCAGETAQIERAERRYSWLRRRLAAKAEIWAIFPDSWRLTQRMCLLFAQVTRTHLAEILDNKVRAQRLQDIHSTASLSLSPYCVPSKDSEW